MKIKNIVSVISLALIAAFADEPSTNKSPIIASQEKLDKAMELIKPSTNLVDFAKFNTNGVSFNILTNNEELIQPTLFLMVIVNTNKIIELVEKGTTNYLKAEVLGTSTNFVAVHLEYKKN